MTPEKIAEIRQNASVAFLQRIWEATAQLGMQSTADGAQIAAELGEAKEKISELNAELEKLKPAEAVSDAGP